MGRNGYPTPATMARTEGVRKAIHLTFAEAVCRLSKLQKLTLEEYCSSENVPGYITNIFTDDEKEELNSGKPVMELSQLLLYKVLRFASGLAPRETHIWETDSDSIEYLIYITNKEIQTLDEAPALSDYMLNQRLNMLVECLIGILIKVEKMSDDDLSIVKKKVLLSLASQDSLSDVDYCFKISTQQLIHQVFRLTYNLLNNLGGKTEESFLMSRSKSFKSFSIEERELLRDNTKSKPLRLIYKLLPKVCVLKAWKQRAEENNTIEHSLFKLKKESDTIINIDSKSITERSRKLYKLLEDVVNHLSEKTSKSYKEIVAQIPDDTQCLDDSFQKLPSRTQSCDSLAANLPYNSTDSKIRSSSLPSTPDSSDTNVLSCEELNISILFKALRPGGITAKVLYFTFTKLHGHLFLADPEQESKFTTKEKPIVTDENKLKDADITLLSKLLRFTCDLEPNGHAVWITVGDTIEYSITFVKNERNKFAHETTSLTHEELKKILADLEFYLEIILVKTSEKKNIDLQNEIDEMKEELKVLRPDRKIMEKIKKEMNQSLSDKVVSDTQQELRKAYQGISLNNSSPITWIHEKLFENILIDKVYMKQDLIDAGGTNKKYALEDLLSPENNNVRVLVIQGESGVGKTTLCKHITYLWKTNNPDLKDVDLLFHIECRNITASSSSLASYLRNKYPTFRNIEESDIIPILQDPRVLLVVDGYDEAQIHAKDLLDDILSSLPESRMIITSKPQWVPKLESKVHHKTSSSNYRVLSLIGCNKDKRSQYIKNYFIAILEGDQKKEAKCDEFLKFLHEQEDKLQALIEKPLTLALLICLWIKDSKKAKNTRTVGQLYKTLTDFTLERFIDKENMESGNYDSFRKWLGEIAWKNLQENQLCLMESDIEMLKEKGEERKIDCMKALPYVLHCYTLQTLTEDTVYTFIHLSQQEFLSAEYIKTQLLNKSEESLEKILGLTHEDWENSKNEKKLQRLIPVVEFLADLKMNEKRLKEIAEMTLKVQAPWSFVSVRKMFKQLIDISKYKAIFKEIPGDRELSGFLEGYDPESLQWVLENTSLTVPSSVHLRNSVTEVLRMKDLLVLLKNKSCIPEVTVVIDSIQNIPKIIDSIKDIESKTSRVAIMIGNPCSLTTLLKQWHWSHHLCLYFPMEVFPLLWWVLVANLVASEKTGVLIEHGLRDTSLIDSGLSRLGAKVIHNSNNSPSHLLIKSDPPENEFSRPTI